MPVLRGIHSSTAGMRAHQTQVDTAAANLSNVNTPAYQREAAVVESFPDLLLARLGDSSQPVPTGPLGTGTRAVTVPARPQQGGVRPTGRPLDLAIVGEGLLVVATPAGLRYTRRGELQRDAFGRLNGPGGHPVLVDGRPLVAGAETVSIQPDGRVSVGGRAAGTLDVVAPAGPLEPAGDGLWAAPPGAVLPRVAAVRLQPGHLEEATLDLAQEMTDLMAGVRAFALNGRALQIQDETLGRAVSEIGRV